MSFNVIATSRIGSQAGQPLNAPPAVRSEAVGNLSKLGAGIIPRGLLRADSDDRSQLSSNA
jgi:hypothetical protein